MWRWRGGRWRRWRCGLIKMRKKDSEECLGCSENSVFHLIVKWDNKPRDQNRDPEFLLEKSVFVWVKWALWCKQWVPTVCAHWSFSSAYFCCVPLRDTVSLRVYLFIFCFVPIWMCATSNPLPDIIPWAFSFEMEINHTGVFPQGLPVIHEMELFWHNVSATEILGWCEILWLQNKSRGWSRSM